MMPFDIHVHKIFMLWLVETGYPIKCLRSYTVQGHVFDQCGQSSSRDEGMVKREDVGSLSQEGQSES